MKLLPILVILGSCTLGWGAGEGFEDSAVGQEVSARSHWTGSAAVTDEESASGSNSLRVNAGETVVFQPDAVESVSYWDFYLLPSFAASIGQTLNITGAKLGFTVQGAVGKVRASDGETAVETAPDFPLISGTDGGENWVRITVRIDRGKKEWDLFLDGKPILAAAKLDQGDSLSLTGPAGSGPVYLDDVQVSKNCPLFADSDNDGMPDTEELANGLNPFVDDRDADPDGDGIRNILEFFAGSHPQSGVPLLPGTGVYVFVDNVSGNDAFSGRRSYAAGNEGPKAGIKAAMTAAPSGATIFVLPGTGLYKEGSMGIKNKRLTIRVLGDVKIQ